MAVCVSSPPFDYDGAVELTLHSRRVWGRKPTAEEEEERKVKSEETDVKYPAM